MRRQVKKQQVGNGGTPPPQTRHLGNKMQKREKKTWKAKKRCQKRHGQLLGIFSAYLVQ